MASLTQFLKLYKPVSDEIGWDDNMNANLDTLDGFMNQFMSVPGFVGAWSNNTNYTVGNITLEISSGSFYQAQVAHTSSAPPTTFLQERTGRPGLWVLNNNAAQTSAAQAAASAAAAAGSASSASASAASAAASASASAGALLKTGGTMTGPLTLAHDPVGSLESATKQYVDAHIGGAGFLPLTGGTMTGALSVLPPTLGSHPATKTYADTTFLPTTGGTLTGPLTLPVGAPVGGNTAANKAYVDSTVAGAGFLPITGGTLAPPGNLAIPVGAVFQAGTAQFFQTAQFTVQNMEGNWRWLYNRGTGALTWQRGSDGASLVSVDPSGNVTALAANFAVNGIFSNIVRGVNGVSCTGDDSMFFTASPTVRIMRFTADGWQWVWDATNGNLGWNTVDGAFVNFRHIDGFVVNFKGGFIAAGSIVLQSDARLKQNVTPVTGALATVMQMKPSTFQWIADGTEDYGFVAQDMQPVMPDCVGVAGIELPDGTGGVDDANPTLGIKSYQLLTMAIAAIQELNTTLGAMQARLDALA
jgi:hypothetical protein